MEIEKKPTISNKKSNDAEKIIQDLISSAEKGDINSQLKLGKLYYYGSGIVDYFDEEKHEKIKKLVHTEKSTQKVKSIFEKLAKEHDEQNEAIFYLARVYYIFYDNGFLEKALVQFQKCIDRNYAPALHFLGFFY